MSLLVYRLPASKLFVYRNIFYAIRNSVCVSWNYHKVFCGYPHMEFVPQAVAFAQKRCGLR